MASSLPSRRKIHDTGTQRTASSYPMIDLENGAPRHSSSSDGSAAGTSELTSPAEPTRRSPVDNFEEHPFLVHYLKQFSSFEHLPMPMRKVLRAFSTWLKGPQPPRPYHIEPFFGRVQTAPTKLFTVYIPKIRHRIWILMAFYIIWLSVFIFILHKSTSTGEIGGYGSPVRLSCISRFWPNTTYCGLNGGRCRPFDNSTFPFRCPSNCKGVEVLNPYAIGAEKINYRSLVVGGPTSSESVENSIYRGDSFICGAAIHAGVIRNQRGGCGIVSLVGEKSHYPSVTKNGISSVGFNSSFPLSFTFAQGDKSTQRTLSQCRDPRWQLLSLSITFTALVSVFATSPALFFSTAFIGVYFQVALASDPPDFQDFALVVSSAFGRFLPAAFIGLFIYRYCVQRSLHQLTAQYEKTILWLGACWVGALGDTTLGKIPIQRLTPHDLQQQPGAISALILIVLAIIIIALTQAWAFRIEGRLPLYLAVYTIMGVCVLLLMVVPGLKLRIHHYILALLLLPGTALQTRPSLLYQGLLVGLFINGIARWGFSSILQTPAALLEDGQIGSLLPQIAAPIINASSITFSWSALAKGYDGMSVLVNDVERFRRFQGQGPDSFTWTRHSQGDPEYFRFGYVKYGRVSEISVGDYSKAGIWEEDGNWVHMQPGPSR